MSFSLTAGCFWAACLWAGCTSQPSVSLIVSTAKRLARSFDARGVLRDAEGWKEVSVAAR